MDFSLPPPVESLLDFFTPLDDARRLYRLQGEGELQALKVQAWSQREDLSAPYDLEILALSLDARLNLDAIRGARVSLYSRLADGSEHHRGGTILRVVSEHAEGGFASYRLHVGPWFSLLAYATHSRVWQDKSVIDIIDSILGLYPHAQWRWADDVADHLTQSPLHNAAGQRSYCVQYRETDLAFVERLLAEEGLVYRFEAASVGSAGDGSAGDESASAPDALVILADTTRASSCPEDPCSVSPAGGPGIRFHRDAAVEEQDVILAFGERKRLIPCTATMVGWNDQTKRAVAAIIPTVAKFGANTPRLEAYDPGHRYLDTSTTPNTKAQRAATFVMQTHEASHHVWLGRGSVRSLTCGEHLRLQGSPLDALTDRFDVDPGVGEALREFLVTRVIHAGINNLPQQLSEALANTGFDERDYYAVPILPAWIDDEQRAQAAKSGYANRFEALRRGVPWRAPVLDDNGRWIQRRPRATMQIATVVGPNGQSTPQGADEIHMDRQGRIRIQYEFQRQPGLPATSPITSITSTWVRVLQSWAGAGMGCQFIPRIGHEVLIDFHDNDIDRPYVMKVLYTGRGEGGTPATPGGKHAHTNATDAAVYGTSSDHRPSGQGNLSGGHSPAWHGASPGSLDAKGQANAAALSGIKTKEFGGTGYNQLVFDDTDNQLRVQLHTSQHASQLNLGHLIHQADNHRGGLRGQGFELRTDAYGAIRAKQGVLLSSYGQSPQEPAGDNTAALALHAQLWTMSKAMSELAKTHETVTLAAVAGSFYADGSLAIGTYAPLEAMDKILKGMVDPSSLDQALTDAAAHNTSTTNKLPHSSEPVVVIAAKAGLVQVAGQHIEAAAGDTLSLGAGQDIHQAAGGAFRLHTGQAIGMLAGATKPGDQAAGKGITLIAGAGDVDVQAQSDAMQIAAKGDVSIQSQSSHIDWAAAKKIVLATAGGASVTIEGGNIVFECPGTITIEAGKKSFTGPATYAHGMNAMPGGGKFDEEMVLAWFYDKKPVVNRRFEITRADGTVVRGVTDDAGKTGLQKSEFFEALEFKLLDEV